MLLNYHRKAAEKQAEPAPRKRSRKSKPVEADQDTKPTGDESNE